MKTVGGEEPRHWAERSVASALKKAQEVYAELAKSDADAGYAVDEIKGLLAKLPAEGIRSGIARTGSGWKAVAGDPNDPPGDEGQGAGEGATQRPGAAMAEEHGSPKTASSPGPLTEEPDARIGEELRKLLN